MAHEHRPVPIQFPNHRGCAIVRRLGVAAASAALVGTIAAVMPAGIAHAAATPIPNPSGNLRTTGGQHPAWRATRIVDQPGPDVHGTLPAVSGDRLVLNKEGEQSLANAVWWNNPIPITGQSIAVSFKTYFDLGAQAGPPPAHGQGLAFALIE